MHRLIIDMFSYDLICLREYKQCFRALTLSSHLQQSGEELKATNISHWIFALTGCLLQTRSLGTGPAFTFLYIL